MKRVFWITLALWALAAQTVATQPPADSLCLWFERGEKGKWLQAVARWQEQAGHKIELPDPLQYATLPRSLRPAWARVSDEELWEMLQVADKRIVHLIDLRSRGTRALWTVESAQEVTMHRAAAPWRIAALAFALAGMIITGLAAYRKWSKRFDPRAR